MEDGMRRPNMNFMKVPWEEIRYDERKLKFEEIFMEDFPELKKGNAY